MTADLIISYDGTLNDDDAVAVPSDPNVEAAAIDDGPRPA